MKIRFMKQGPGWFYFVRISCMTHLSQSQSLRLDAALYNVAIASVESENVAVKNLLDVQCN